MRTADYKCPACGTIEERWFSDTEINTLHDGYIPDLVGCEVCGEADGSPESTTVIYKYCMRRIISPFPKHVSWSSWNAI